MTLTEAFERGKNDAARNRPSIFRFTRNCIVPTIDDDMADNWDNEQREMYLRGYNLDEY